MIVQNILKLEELKRYKRLKNKQFILTGGKFEFLVSSCTIPITFPSIFFAFYKLLKKNSVFLDFCFAERELQMMVRKSMSRP